jgi:hypothetical protein
MMRLIFAAIGGSPHSLQSAPRPSFLEVRKLDSNRTLAVLLSRHLTRFAALSLVAALAACDDETTVEPPPPVPQIATTQSYSKNTSTGLPNAEVYALLTLSNGEFWVGTAQGIARYPSVTATQRIPGPEGVINELNGLPNPKVRDMVEMNGKVYVATWGGGFAIYDVAGGTWESRTPADDTADDVHPQNVSLGRSVTPGSGVIVQPGPNGILETVPQGDDRISGNNIIDGASGNGIAETTAHRALNGSISDIEPSPVEGKLYLATNDAISIYEPALDRFSSFTSVTREIVSAVGVRDTPGGIERWYGPRVETVEDDPPPPMPAAGITVSRGVSTFYSLTKVNSGLPEPNVTAIFYDPDGGVDVLWVATANAGVSRVQVDASTWTNYTALQGLPSNTVYSVARAAAPGGGTTIWVATQNGVARLKGDGTWQGYNTGGGLAGDRVRKVYSDDGLRLWIGYVDAGAARLNASGAQ